MPATFPLPIALRTLSEKLNYPVTEPEIVGRFSVFYADMADLKISLTDKAPCIWVQSEDLSSLSVSELAQSLLDIAREKYWHSEIILVFLDGATLTLRSHLPKYDPSFVVISQEDQKSIQKAASPSYELMKILIQQIPLSHIAPYEVHRPVVGNQFFGRDTEINRMLAHPTKSFLIVGIRRVGKTSLLVELKRRLERRDRPDAGKCHTIFIDCSVVTSEAEFWSAIISAADRDSLKFFFGRPSQSRRYKRQMFDRFAAINGGPITFLIDEIDRLLVNLEDEHDLFDLLRSAATSGNARFIMAGFRRPLSLYGSEDSTFYHFAHLVPLGRMLRNEIHDMILVPMESLGIKVQNREEVVNRIYRETGGLPNYVQFYCQTLVMQMEQEGRLEIVENDLASIYENREFRDFVLDTFMHNTTPMEQALVYTLTVENIRSNSPRTVFSERNMDFGLKKHKLYYTLRQIEQACKNLEIGGVLKPSGKDYEFAVPLLQRILSENRDVGFLLEKIREDILRERFLD